MRFLTRVCCVLVIAIVVAQTARAQSFNIDIGTLSDGAPAVTFGAAANQRGAWNNMTGTGLGPIALVDVNGAVTSATFSRTSGAGGNFNSNNTNTSGNYALLLDDAQDLAAAGGVVTYTIGGLAAGNYGIYVYGIAPDSPTSTTVVSFPPPAILYWAGGAMPVDGFAFELTHVVMRTTLTVTGSINVRVATATGSGRCNGIQIVRRQYVNHNATGANNGRNWTDAYTSLQSALVTGATGEILVAAGTYKPTTGTSRTESFQLQNDLAVYGGFSGTEEDIGLRDPATNVTILSGDLGTIGNTTDNSYHVVNATGTVDSTAVLDGFTIQSGFANGSSPNNRGGGLLLTGSPTIRNCNIQNNSCIDGGGGVYSTGSPTLIDCAIRSNSSTVAGNNGGGIRLGGGVFSLINSSVVQNTTTNSGAGLAVASSAATANIYNCIFNNNAASANGGAINTMGTLNVTNCTFVNNTVTNLVGAGVRVSSGTANIQNSAFWNNPGTSQISAASGGSYVVTYCNVQGGFTGTGNINGDPLFADADGPDNVPGNSDDDVRLLNGSPCADTGSTAALPADGTDLDGDGDTTESLPMDLGRRPRVAGTAVDIGAYEVANVYVKADATGANDGSSWTNAFTSLNSALAATSSQDLEAIWIASGTYKPTQQPPQLPSSPSYSFVLPTGVALLGGFAGTETSVSQRNPTVNVTILSGDQNGDDDSNPPIYTDNCRHVVKVAAGVSAAVIDGVTITAGRAQSAAPDNAGAGIHCVGQAVIRNCTISENLANLNGGGVYNTGDLTLLDCILKQNSTNGCCGLNNGGAAINNTGELSLTRCTIQGNLTAYSGAGLHQSAGSTTVSACSFLGNRASPGSGDLPGGVGGGIFKSGGTLDVQNSIFLANVGDSGGGIYVADAGTLTVRHCTFAANSAAYAPGGAGGAISARLLANATLFNCIFWGNVADSRHTELYVPATAAVTNCVIGRGAIDAVSDGVPGAGWAGILDLDPMLTPDGRLRAGSPCINAGTNTGALTTDIDGENRPNPAGGAVDIGADEFVDGDADGMPDVWEQRYFGSPTSASATTDSDADLNNNLAEYAELGSVPNLPPLYVSPTGNDANTGATSGTAKRTLQAALNAVTNGSTIRVGAGVYTGAGNYELDFGGKSVVLVGSLSGFPLSYPDIDCGGAGRVITEPTLQGAQAIFSGLDIRNGAADFGGAVQFAPETRIQFRACTLSGNTATVGDSIYSRVAAPTFAGGLIGNTLLPASTEDVIAKSRVELRSNWTIGGVLDVRSSVLVGQGDLRLNANGTLVIRGDAPGDRATVAYTDILGGTQGNGNIIIDAGQELHLVNGATIDLSGATGASACTCPATLTAGTVTVNGKLVANGGRVQNTNVVVNQGDIGDGTFIVHNDISLPQSVAATAQTPGFGGEFFVENDSTICCNHIISYGDRYLDIDPDPDPLAPNPDVQNNTIDVIITQSTADGQGELLELRAFDYDTAIPCPGHPAPCAIQPPANSPGLSDTWTINQLEVRENGRVTLTNRKNFDFDLNPNTQDTIYIKTLVLFPNSVFNVGLQRAYYQTLKLVDSAGNLITTNPPPPYVNGAQIVDVPLLGFSLKVINFEDETAAPFNETDIRLRTRVQDDPTLDPADPSTPLGSVGRVTWNGRKGLSMDTQVDGHPTVSMVAIKGAFARAGEDEIEVSFIYDWRGNTPSSSRLRVYLSDSPEVGQNLGPLLATISPPTSGSGTVTGISWATFTGKFPRGNLDLRRGTFIELQLTGNNAHITIDDFDPLVCGSPTCGDIGGDPSYDWTVSGVDFLYLLAEQGKASGGSNYCADLMSGDKYVDLSDLLLWESQLQNSNANLCGTSSGSPAPLPAANIPATLPPDTLLIAGKSAQLQTQLPNGEPDRFPALLFGVNPALAMGGPGTLPPGASQISEALGHGRLSRNSSGVLFQLHGGFGLMRLADGVVVAPRGDKPCANPPSQVHLGFWTTGDVPVLDAAFDRTNPTIVYVTPVRVFDAVNSTEIYKASARVKLLPTLEAYIVERVYGQNPYAPGATNTEPPQYASVNVQHQREIEADGLGNLFVLSAKSTLNNDNNWLLLYRASDGFERRILLPTALAGPSAMMVTQDNQKLYIAAGISDGSTNPSSIYRYTIVRSGNEATGIALDGIYTITNMRLVTALAEGIGGAIHAVGYQAPSFDINHAFADNENLFTTPALANLPSTPQTVPAQVIAGGNLALPMSAILANTGCPGPKGDFDGDQAVTAGDVPGFVNVMLNGTGGSAQTLCRADFTLDGLANGRDITGFVQAVIP